MEFLDEETRPRFLFQSRNLQTLTNPPPKSLSKPTLFISFSLSALILSLTFFFLPNSEPLTSFLIWVSLSLLLGPFAPNSLTGGDISVGHGPIVETPLIETEKEETKETKIVKKHKFRGSNWKNGEDGGEKVEILERKVENFEGGEKRERSVVEEEEEREWSEEDFELLKKLMVKYPVGKLRRWEVITEAFNGRHKLENVIKMAKCSPERKLKNGEDDSFARFLKNRKGMDKKVNNVGVVDGSETKNGEVKKEEGEIGWSSSEDVALLNALKAFPKDVAMRWEKISAAVPGKSKNACMKRVAELKRDFRSSKAASEHN